MQAPTIAPDSQAAAPGKRVVMIDDQASYTEALASAFGILSNLDVVGKATNGSAGIKVALELQPDLVLCDYRMPGGSNGIECATRLRESGYGGEIVILTGHAAPHIHVEAGRINDVRVIAKDLDIPDIISTITGTGIVRPAQLFEASHGSFAGETANSRRPTKLVLATAAVATVVVAAVGFGVLNGSNESAGTPEDRTSITGVTLERPFVIVDGTAGEVRVAVEIDWQSSNAFMPANLPATIAIDAPTPDTNVRVVVENLNGDGTTSCSIGVANQVLATQTSDDVKTTCNSTLG